MYNAQTEKANQSEEEFFEEIDIDEIPDSENGYKLVGTDGLGKKVYLRSYVKTARAAESEANAVGIRLDSLKPVSLGRPVRRIPKDQELATLARNFGYRTEAGNTPKQILKDLSESEVNETLADALTGTLVAVENGRELHEAFDIQRDPKGNRVFPREFVSAIDIGILIGGTKNNESGKSESGLLITLRRFAEGREKTAKFKSAIKSAMIYPGIVAFVAIGAIAVVSIFVMPVMEDIYKSLLQGKDTTLPWMTRAMLWLSHNIASWQGVFTLAGIGVGIYYLLKWLKSPNGQDWLGKKIIYLPKGIGEFYRMIYAAQVLRYLSMLSAGGIEIKEQFKLAAETCENSVFREMLENLRYVSRIQGRELSKLFKPYLFLFGREFLSTLKTADETGDPSEPFYLYAEVLEQRVNDRITAMLEIFKNIIILPLCGVAGFIAAAIITPFFELAGRISSN